MWRMITLQVLILSVFCGCSSVPQATKFHAGTQKKMQAAKHWDVLAKDISQKIKKAIDRNPELSMKAVCLETDDNSPFGQIFKDMLKYNLFNSNILLSDDPNDSIHLKYSTRLLHHNADRVTGDYVAREKLLPGSVLLGAGAALGTVAVVRAVDFSTFAAGQAALVGSAVALGAAGLMEMAIASQYTSITNTEYIFLAEILYSGKTYDMYMDVYYINSEDAYQYMAQVNMVPYKSDTALSGKTMKVVGDDTKNTTRQPGK
ncbi:hypothetical protein [Desulfolutivibrio sulfoxidireducens]|uniref:hypothetical protein n=1 Tax=Desulfolutivibrio sulfoxidireducens TaxID=2773299 RepID=UPI00159E7EA2|nr:hypothetical protein [Desulfolutivibrio sulfoxidireducens]QLA15416.1 hypothetical protein GD605_04305 [Desulfolutivibrio sulfoxidireducens]